MFRKKEEIELAEMVGKVIHKLRTLGNERSKAIEEIERLRGDAEKESEETEKELSTLREQVASLREVLEEMHRRRRI